VIAEPLRILHTVPHLERGGMQRWLLDVFASSEDVGHHIQHHAAIFGSRDEMLPAFLESNCAIHQLPFGKSGPFAKVSALRDLTAIVKRESIDLIQAHSRFDRLYAYAVGAYCRRPVVNTLHSEFAARRYGKAPRRVAKLRDVLEELLERRVLRGVMSVGAPHLLATWLATSRKRPATTFVAPPIVDSAFLAVPVLAPPQDSDLRLVTVARLVPGKRIDLVIRALAEVRCEYPDATLTVIGDGPERGSLERLTVETGLSSAVDFLGDREDVPSLLSRHHLFVLPTETEGQATAVVEAACAGLGVCVPQLPGLDGVLNDLGSTTLIKALTAAEVATSIEVAAERLTASTSRVRDRDILRQRLDLTSVARKLVSFYRSVV
jgi:glycosyltransferase involved in cell wall biosynthesis